MLRLSDLDQLLGFLPALLFDHEDVGNIVTDLIKALPGYGSVNTFQQATIVTGFSVTSCYVTQRFLQ
jgi:hypothetical protein